jgi:hypothetical protein
MSPIRIYAQNIIVPCKDGRAGKNSDPQTGIRNAWMEKRNGFQSGYGTWSGAESMKIKISASCGLAAQSESTIEVDDKATDDEIQEEVFEYILTDMLDFGWEKA